MKLYYFEEALINAKRKGVINAKKQIREKYWSKSSPSSQESNISNMINEHTIPTLAFTIVVAEICQCSTDFICYGKEKEKEKL